MRTIYLHVGYHKEAEKRELHSPETDSKRLEKIAAEQAIEPANRKYQRLF